MILRGCQRKSRFHNSHRARLYAALPLDSRSPRATSRGEGPPYGHETTCSCIPSLKEITYAIAASGHGGFGCFQRDGCAWAERRHGPLVLQLASCVRCVVAATGLGPTAARVQI